MKFNLTFAWKIFIFYSIFVSLLIFVIVIGIYLYISSSLTKSTFLSMEQSVKRISAQTDTIIDKMDNLSQSVLFNSDVQDALIETLPYQSGNLNYFELFPDRRNIVKNTLLSIIGIKDIPRRVALYNGKNNFASFSIVPDTEGSVKSDLRELPWIKEMNVHKSNTIFLPPHPDLWSVDQSSSNVISFIRRLLYIKGSSAQIGYIEIQQPSSMLDDIVKLSLTTNTRIFIRDDQGQLVFPYNEPKNDQPDYYFKLIPFTQTPKTLTIKNPIDGSTELVYQYYSPITKWTFLQVIAQRELMTPVYRMQQLIITVGIILILITLLIIYLITNSLTAPIKQLRKSLKIISVETPSLDLSIQGSNNEIILLNRAFNKTIQKFHESMNHTIEARSKEVEAHFLALQAQMDPHFLYNSLMAISAVGQEYDNPLVVEMCSKLSHMLRYTASYKVSIVHLSDELKHAENYISMMKLRFEGNITYEFIMDDGMTSIEVPKLIVQPLIENAFSHGFAHRKPPYRVVVTGRVEDSSWSITVADNGSGFTTESLEIIKKQIKAYDLSLDNNTYKDKLDIGGMTLYNVYVRLKMLYQEEMIFHIANNDDSGAQIMIGGRIRIREND